MRRFDESELEAYVDGELSALRRAELSAWLSRNPEAQALTETWRYQKAGLRALFDPLLHRPAPPRIRAVLSDKDLPARRVRLRRAVSNRACWNRIAAVGLLLTLSGLTGWIAKSYSLTYATPVEVSLENPDLLGKARMLCGLPDDIEWTRPGL